MIRFHVWKVGAPVLLLAWVASGCTPDADRRSRIDLDYLRIAEAEDARPEGGRELALLVEATASEDVFLRGMAVRALGRLERPEHAPAIEALLLDPAAEVQAQAAHALAQAHRTSPGSAALAPLISALDSEPDPSVRGTLARSIGRLDLTPPEGATAIRALVAASRDDGGDAPVETLLGVVLGLETLVRAGHPLREGAVRRLEALVGYHVGAFEDPETARLRTLAVKTLARSGSLTPAVVERALRDREAPQAGAVAIAALGTIAEGARPELVRRAVANPAPATIIEAFRYLAGQPRTEARCRFLFAGVPPSRPGAPGAIPTGIRIVAIDALAEPCPDLARQQALLQATMDGLPAGDGSWQPAAHALLALAQVGPAEATAALPTFVRHPDPFVRAYAARAALRLSDQDALETLSEDPSANVRSVALDGLFTLAGHRIDDLLLGQLAADDPQLLMTVARLLEGTPSPAAAEALLEAFERVSAAGRETSRDARTALLARIGAVGSDDLTDRLLPYLSDYDVVVASDVAAILGVWNARPYEPTPEPLARQPLPTAQELRAMDGAVVVLHMRSGGTITIELLPYLATTNAFRFYRLASAGYFDGLTFHRWAPNFVIQGGSPGANEYSGDGPYTRDEVGRLGHWRGTVGISTRGHDTGDGQIFVNLMDNVRLDHAYTIMGRVVDGMDVVDSVLEGSVIDRAEVRSNRASY